MRPELNHIEKIDAYLSGNMTPEEKSAFEKQISENQVLAEAVEIQKNLRKALENIRLKSAIQRVRTRYKIYKGIKYTGIVLSATLAGIMLLYSISVFFNGNSSDKNEEEWNIHIPDCPSGSNDCYTPGNLIPSQEFTIDGNQDTVITGKQGLLLVIPQGSFINEKGQTVSGKIQIELKEALDPATIMLSGLSTFSGDRLLETGGMFYIQAYQNGKKLGIVPEGILAKVPVLETKPGMMLYDGEELPDGSVNWIDPKPLVSALMPVDMSQLDFYPPGYISQIQKMELNYSDKAYRDSVYLSFEEQSIETTGIPLLGQEMFKSNCARCHYNNDQKFIGPGLGDVRQRWDSEENLRAFIQNPSELLKTGHPYANQLYKEYGKQQMPAFNMTDREIEAILEYTDSYNRYETDSIIRQMYGISPSKVLAFWNEQFNHTYLATKEFEDRMKKIHHTCDNAILDIYIQNIDKDLYYADSLAAAIYGGEFRNYAALKLGNVASADKKFRILQGFYARQAAIYKEAGIQSTRNFFQKHTELDQHAFAKSITQEAANYSREQKVLVEEYEKNLDEAYRQLGYKRPVNMTSSNNSVTALITSSGWKNIDREVWESVANRTTLDFTDEKGNKAHIGYKECRISVQAFQQFDRIQVYLVPQQLSSYMLIPGNNGTYTEKLNEFLMYDLFVIGYREQQIFLYNRSNFPPGNYPAIILEKTTLQEVNNKLGRSSNYSAAQHLQQSLEYTLFEITDEKRKNHVQWVKKMREELLPVIYPCSYLSENITYDSIQVTKTQ